MDWEKIKATICEGRRFSLTDSGRSVLTDTLMPSGAAIYVHIQSRGDCLSAHDAGAAFDELARQGGEIKSLRGVRAMLHETKFRLTNDGLVWRDRMPQERAADLVSIVADASFRAASYLLDHARLPASLPLDRRIKDLLKVRFPTGRPNFVVEGKHRQHTFDFGVVVGDQTHLMQAVTPDPSSVPSAIVKGIDAQ